MAMSWMDVPGDKLLEPKVGYVSLRCFICQCFYVFVSLNVVAWVKFKLQWY